MLSPRAAQVDFIREAAAPLIHDFVADEQHGLKRVNRIAAGVDRTCLLAELDADPSPLVPWGERHTFTMPHMVLPFAGRGPFPLPGSIAKVRQGKNVPFGAGVATTGPAYRFVADLSEDAAYTAIAGGIDGAFYAKSYARWLSDWRDGHDHRLTPPAD